VEVKASSVIVFSVRPSSAGPDPVVSENDLGAKGASLFD
jgi:hypothetical protein